ncbi:AraC family transcriptional regulator [Allomuricauda sp. ARW1Y1]|jgi:AraC-like DNA-binding protein|uniref:AraC family transcriptional regulator n=1 Tax=Allomuricauda sp. ARW1Y1 TaxID=2663843 RepID=UPI0015CD5E4A|nr:AraC family transcriptional regulator [Muricauda sp. ARW1Y1]NYJ26211.1 AraC-like DNA-binding protein [Muricauda sp. ARW1Y1]
MKIQLENIQPNDKSSFHLLHNPKLNDLFFWHFHPEFELVYIEGANGKRHVGRHISNFKGSDLVLIGSNIPHLNFDHGIKTEYHKEVLHISASFKEKVFTEIQELEDVYGLLDRSQHGIAFYGETKQTVGSLMKQLQGMNRFGQLLKILQLLKLLAQSEEYILLHDNPIINNKANKQQERLQKVYSYIDEHYSRKIALEDIAASINLGKEAFCRYFKKNTGSTFTRFLNQYRITQAKRMLLTGKNIGETCYECGFESLSYFNRTFKRISGENPSDYKKRNR